MTPVLVTLVSTVKLNGDPCGRSVTTIESDVEIFLRCGKRPTFNSKPL